MATAAPVPLLQAPRNEQPFGDKGQHTPAWQQYFDQINDSVNAIHINNGVTDGSDARAGQVGEVMTASGSGVALANNTVTTVATLNLTAGDWDVSGGVTFTLSSAASNHYAAGIDGTFGSEIIATIPTGSGTQRLSAGAPVRRNVTAATAVHLSALAGFSAGAVSAAGTLSARRMR